MPRATPEAPDLVVQEYLRVLKRWKWVILVVVLGCVGATLGWSLNQAKVYQSQAEVLLQPRSNENLFNALNDIRDPTRLAQTEMKVIESQPVRELVARTLGSDPAIETSQSGVADIIEIRARDVDPIRAAAIANAYADGYIEFRHTRAIDDILAASAQIQARIDSLQREIEALAAETPPGDPATASPANAVVASQIASLGAQQSTFKQKFDQLEVDSALTTGGAEVVNPAVPSTSPVEPSPVSDGLTAAVVGVILALGIAFLLEYLDDSIKTKEHLERAIGPGVPTLGLIPEIDNADLDRSASVGVVATGSRPAEAFRALRTSIQFVGLEEPRLLQVTSPTLAEGKTTTAVNLAIVLARAGMKVVLADCDLRRPRVHQMFNLPMAPGFTSVVMGESPIGTTLHRIPDAGHLHVLTSGPIPPNPSEILFHRRTADILDSLADLADIVLLDSPPLLPVTDASVLAGRVTAVLLVAAAGRTRQRQIRRAVELLGQVHAPLVGTVLVRVRADARNYDDYSHYAAESPANGRRPSGKGSGKGSNDTTHSARRMARQHSSPSPGAERRSSDAT